MEISVSAHNQSSPQAKIALSVLFFVDAKKYTLNDLKTKKPENLAMFLLVAMNGFVAFARNQKLNVLTVNIVAYSPSLTMSSIGIFLAKITAAMIS
jgi:hypothetical protein